MRVSEKRRMNTQGSRGFTLIELVIVIAVIAILAALLVPTILGQTERSRVASAKNNVQEMAKALARIRTDTHYRPDDAADALSNCYAIAYLAAASSVAVKTATEPACGDADLPACSSLGPANADEPCWSGPYLHARPDMTDPWGTAWSVSYEPVAGHITVTSAGPDRDMTATGDNIKNVQ